MPSLFPAYVCQGYEAGTAVQEYVPGQATNEPCIVGDFFFVDTADNGEAKRCGTNPTLIAGISEISTEAGRVLTPNGRVPLRNIHGQSVRIAMSSTTTPVYATHVGNSYGITRAAGGQWQLDVSKTTTSSRVRVVAVDEAAGIFYVVVHENLLQFSDVEVATA